MNQQKPLRVGDPVIADSLKGRVTAVYAGGAYYRVRFPIPSPYFWDDEGAVFRQHEVSLQTQPHEPESNRLPARMNPFNKRK